MSFSPEQPPSASEDPRSLSIRPFLAFGDVESEPTPVTAPIPDPDPDPDSVPLALKEGEPALLKAFGYVPPGCIVMHEVPSPPEISPPVEVVSRPKPKREPKVNVPVAESFTDMSGYDGNATKYLARLRNTDAVDRPNIEMSTGSKEEQQIISGHAADYFATRQKLLQRLITPSMGMKELEELFKKDLYGVAALSKGIIEMRNARLAQKDPVTYVDSRSDFFSLPSEDRDAIVMEFGLEWRDMYQIIRGHDESLLSSSLKSKRSYPLAFLSPGDLHTGIRRNPLLLPAEVCEDFIDSPGAFKRIVNNKSRAKRVEGYIEQYNSTLATRINRDTIAYTHERATTTAQNRKRIQELKKDPEVNADLVGLGPGDTIRIGELNTPIANSTFDTYLAKQLELIGRTLYSRAAGRQTRGFLMDFRHPNIGGIMCNDFHGSMQNLTISRLEVTESDLQEHFKRRFTRSTPKPNNYAQLIIGVELKSTGRKPQLNLLRMLMVAEMATSEKQLDKVRISDSILTNAPEVVGRMAQEAKTAAYLAELWSYTTVRRG